MNDSSNKNVHGNTTLSSGTIYQPQPTQPLINVRPKQAAKELGYSISWLYELINKGVLPKPHPIYKGSRAVAFYRHELDEVIARNTNMDGGNHEAK